MSDPKDDAKKKILARRASFVAAALAGVACGKEPAEPPQPCLSVAFTAAADAAPEPPPTAPTVMPPDTVPMPCLSISPQHPPPPDGGAAPVPRPCLKPVAPR